ncbi:MAG: hypothetical protein ACMUIG_07845 [Thermoplasmatota archaeon]
MNDEEDLESISLKVVSSSIESVDSGIARIHSSYLDDIDLGENNLVTLRSEDRSVTAKLVSDKLADKGAVVLREGDMKRLQVDDGDMIDMEPYSSVKDDVKVLWEKFKDKFRKGSETEETG